MNVDKRLLSLSVLMVGFLISVPSWLYLSFKVKTNPRFRKSHTCFSGMKAGERNLVTRWLYSGVVTSGLIHRENGRRFLTPINCASCLLTGWKAACSGKSGRVRLRPARAKAAFHPLSRQPAQTSGVWKRLPFSMGVFPASQSRLVWLLLKINLSTTIYQWKGPAERSQLIWLFMGVFLKITKLCSSSVLPSYLKNRD